VNRTFLTLALCLTLPATLAPPAGAQQVASAHHNAKFLCLAPAGHTCQFEVRTNQGPIDFALPSGHRRVIGGITPNSDTYCVCDPGPVTPDCKAPRLDHWCLGHWLDVTPGLNSDNGPGEDRFAIQ